MQKLQYLVVVSRDKSKARSMVVFIGGSWESARTCLKRGILPTRKRIRLGTWYRDELVGYAKIVKLKEAHLIRGS